MKLYEINEQIEALLSREVIDIETGEVLDDNGFEELKSLEAERDLKLENIGLFIKNLDADVLAIKEEEKKLADRRKVKENKAKSVKQFLSDYLQIEDLKKFETAKIKLSFRKSESVNVTVAAEKLPSEYYKEKTEYTADKIEIKKALKAGVEIVGAELVESNNLQIK